MVGFDNPQEPKESCDCFACRGSGNVGNKTCFVCGGEGKLSPEQSSNVFKLLENVFRTARQYGLVGMIDNERSFFPLIHFMSDQYPTEELKRIQNEFQQRVVLTLSPREMIRGTVYEVFAEERRRKDEDSFFQLVSQNINYLLLQKKLTISDLDSEVRVRNSSFYKISFRVARDSRDKELYDNLGQCLMEDIEREKEAGGKTESKEKYYRERYIDHTWDELMNGLVV